MAGKIVRVYVIPRILTKLLLIFSQFFGLEIFRFTFNECYRVELQRLQKFCLSLQLLAVLLWLSLQF